MSHCREMRPASQIPVETRLQCSDHMHLCVRVDRSQLDPSSGTVGERQGPAEVSHRLSSILTHQVHGQDARDGGRGSMHV